MTCYLRMHEVLIGIPEQTAPIAWGVAFKAWQQATTVADRERVLTAIGAEAVDIYDLPTADLRRFRGLIASDRVDQEFLHEHRHCIRDFLEAGKTLVFSGELLHPWLPGGQRFAHPAGAGAHQLVTLASHPVFDGITPADLGATFVYGHHHLPEGAEALVTLPGGEAAVYVDRVSTAGTILVHAGHTLMGYAASNAPVQRLVPQVLAWIGQEVAR